MVYKERKSRKQYVCGRCPGTIEKGVLYGIITIFPEERDDWPGDTPLQKKFCIKCFNYYDNYNKRRKGK